MDLTLIDGGIIAVLALATLFGLMWGSLRILFFGICVAIAVIALPITMPLAGEWLDRFVFDRLGDSNTMTFIRDNGVLIASVFVPFVVLSFVLAWPYGMLEKWMNPFINYFIGMVIGLAMGVSLCSGFMILYAHISVGKDRFDVFCNSTLVPYIYDASPIVLDIAINMAAPFPQTQRELKLADLSLTQADPSLPSTCGAITV